jgi:signal transduction histidine kinase
LQLLTVLVPALCAGLYEWVRHSLFASDLPFGLGTVVAVIVVLGISLAFARISFGMIRRMEASLLQRNRELQALSREVERLAVVDERNRLAREIHDGVAQVLATMLVRLDTVEGLLERGRTEAVLEEVRGLRASGAEAYGDVREAIADLRTRPELGPQGLRQALESYVSQFADRTELRATFGFDAIEGDVDDLTPTAEVQLLRIVQEALANVRRHAGASRVDVQFWRDNGGWHVSVRDDGRGFDPTAADTSTGRQEHVGLSIMRERAESVGGSLTITSSPGGGTEVHTLVPLHQPGSLPILRARSTRNAEGRLNGAPAPAAR